MNSGPKSPRVIDVGDFPALQALVSENFSPWSNEILVTQKMIDAFAELSGDDYWIHTDPEQARQLSPFRTTIAHGFLILSLLGKLHIPLDYEIAGFNNMLNYGSDRLRFPAPVPVESRIHAHSRVKRVKPSNRGIEFTIEIAIHTVGNERPSLINEMIILYM
jgi:uncharacterized protein